MALGITVQDGVKADEEPVIPGTGPGIDKLPEGDTPTASPVVVEPAIAPEPEGEKKEPNVFNAVMFPHADAEAQGYRKQAQRETATKWETFKAATDLWVHNAILTSTDKPEFTPEPGFKLSARMGALEYAPSEVEADFLKKARSNEEFDWLAERIEENRQKAMILADNPKTAFAAGMIDPMYILLDVATAGGSRLITGARGAGRLLAGTGAGVGAYALGQMEASVRPMAESDIISMAVMNFIGSSVLYGKPAPRKPRLGDPEIPQVIRNREAVAKAHEDAVETANRVSRDIDNNNLTRVESPDGRVSYHKDNTKGSRQIPEVVSESARRVRESPAGKSVATVARAVDSSPVVALLRRVVGSASGDARAVAQGFADKLGRTVDDVKVEQGPHIQRSSYNAETRTIKLRENAPDWEINHEVAHAATVEKIQYGKVHPESTHGKIVKELDSIRREALESLRDLPDDVRHYLGSTEEFVAGLYSSSPNLRRALAKLPDPGKGGLRSFLDSTLDAIRRLLGMTPRESEAFLRARGLADEILDLPEQVQKINQNAMGTNFPRQFSSPAQAAAEVVEELDSLWKRAAMKGSWSLYKSIAKHSKAAADFLTDNPMGWDKASVASHRQSIINAMEEFQVNLDNSFKVAMANRGASTLKHITQPRKTMKKHMELNEEVYAEMLRRNDLHEAGLPITKGNAPADVIKIADDMGALYKNMLEETQRAGVFGAKDIKHNPGYMPRVYSSSKLTGLQKKIADMMPDNPNAMKAANALIVDAYKRGIMRRGNWTPDDAHSVASAIVDRIHRKGEFSDAQFRGHAGNEVLFEFRDALNAQGLPPHVVDRLIKKLEGKADQADISPRMKDRLRIDMGTTVNMPDGGQVPLSDLLNKDTLNLSNTYVHDMTGRSAFARMGITKQSELAKMKTKWINDAPAGVNRAELNKLLDNTIDQLMGRPVGEDMAVMARMASAFSQMLGLKWSGLWQVTEYATAMQRLGVMRVIGSSVMELPGLRQVFRPNSTEAGSIADVLSRNSSQQLRIRPYITRLEDGFTIETSNVALQTIQYAKQMVPYANMMKSIHKHQARVVGNLIQDNILRAAKGDAKALKSLEMYGIDASMMSRLRPELTKHGVNTDKWSTALWDEMRVPLDRMVDSVVLRSRVGEIPAFAAHSQLGKFIFTFQNFVLGAHNKILMGTLGQQGPIALALMIAYQTPLTIAMVQAASVFKGEGLIDDPQELAEKVIAQMGSLGMFPQLAGVFGGQTSELGAPGLIGVDRFIKTAGALRTMDASKIGKAASGSLPVISVSPWFNWAAAQVFD